MKIEIPKNYEDKFGPAPYADTQPRRHCIITGVAFGDHRAWFVPKWNQGRMEMM
jgi:hypothetical protein